MEYEERTILEYRKMWKEIGELALDALRTDGAHQKQWYLEQILKKLQIVVPDDVGRGIAP